MQPPFPFDDLLVFAFLSIMLLIGIVLRARFGFFQRFLFPSCLIGGFIGLFLVHFKLIKLQPSDIETFAYHLFNVSFISVGLTRDNADAEKPEGIHILKGPAWMALVQGLTFPLQAAVGGIVVMLFSFSGIALFPTFGFLAPLGFNEGPGQALSIGKVWESLGFANAATIGLTFAAIGYFFAFFIGVPLVNKGIRKGEAAYGKKELPKDFITGIIQKRNNRETAGSLTLHPANVETMAFHFALVGGVYGLTYFVVRFLGSFLPADAATILWGFFFFFGLFLALSVKRLLVFAGVDYICDPGIQRRITGWSVDYLIVATIAAIEIAIVWDYIFPIILIALINGVMTTLLVVWMGRQLDAYSLERTAAIFGTVTGTVSCGLLLLRIADPDFKTPAAYEIAVMNVLVLPIIGGCTVLVNAPLWWGWSVLTTVMAYLGIMGISLFLLKLLGFLRMRPAVKG